MVAIAGNASLPPEVGTILKRYWGYETLRPLQAEAIAAGIEGRDSLVVLPTGGGKSLCYQVPPLLAGRTDVVVSPLISLMKDQVDALKAAGYEAAAIHSGLTEAERSDIARAMLAGKLRLVFVSPERLLTPWFIAMMQRAGVSSFAIDEAHCISQWGHDFRPEYRRLAELRKHFPKATIHAFTATATERVRKDIIEQLKLRRPSVLVGRFDRPNLAYRVVPRRNLDQQLLETVIAHRDEAVIVYCISRAETERVADVLKARGVKAAAYHAGMDAKARGRVQDAFAAERLDVVVATVAFGMGIDRSNVRCVIHAAMPKSIEHYQQETGRAGRDGLEAECVLFFGAGDYRRWESVMTRSAEDSSQPGSALKAQMELLSEMQSFCTSQICRHKALSRYFGQDYEGEACGACDVCLTDAPPVENGGEIAREVIECVQALRMPFGVGYVVDVLRGAVSERIEARRHDRLAQYGSLRALSKDVLQGLVFQLIELELLHRSGGDRPVVTVSAKGEALLSTDEEVALRLPTAQPMSSRRRERSEPGWEGIDKGLFEALRALRREIADERRLPPFVVFGDSVLREMARLRPATLDAMRGVKGIGDKKLAELGERFVEAIRTYTKEHPAQGGDTLPQAQLSVPANGTLKHRAFQLFESGASLDEVARSTGRARGTVASYLEEFVALRRPESLDAWVVPEVYERVVTAAPRSQGGLLKPVYEALGGSVGYDEIRIVLKHAGVR